MKLPARATAGGDPLSVAPEARRGLREVPSSVVTRSYRLSLEGWRAFQRGALTQADTLLGQALMLTPTEGTTRYRRAQLLMAQGHDDAALADLEMVLLVSDIGAVIGTHAGRGTIADFHARGIPVAALERLAAADCFRSLDLDRRAALWQVKALARATPLPLFAFAATSDRGAEPPIALPSMPLSEHVVNDYQTLRLSLRAHPMEFLRARCEKERVIDNDRLRQTRNGAFVTVAGIVLVRQRPGSAKGVVFLTLEDEFAVCNAVVWPQVLETHRAIVMGARLMLIRGRVQRAGDIIHVVAARVEDRTPWLALLMEDGRLLRNPLARADEVARPGPDPQPAARHPRQARVIPKSRDFH